MPKPRWEFWIDVGGTFTDCFARRPDGTLLRYKLLSSGVTKGQLAAGSRRNLILDPARATDPADYWTGCELRLLDSEGQPTEHRTIVGFDRERGALHLDKPLRHDPAVGTAYELDAGEEAPVAGIRYLLGLSRAATIPPVSVRLGTTRGTNALVTRRGARTALVTTRGFADILAIGYQNRPRLFDLCVRKPTPLVAAVVEIDERIAADGQVVAPPNPEQVRRELASLESQGIQSLAICLLHGSAWPAHELLVATIARELGFQEISVSSQVAPLVKIVPRGDTTVLDAYLNPVLRHYVQDLRTALAASDLRVLTSAGGLIDADRFLGKDSILSGPAGGVVGFSRVALAAGFTRAIGFDMGGTSTDVSRFDNRFELEFETEKSGVRVVAPMLAIETVAAGGGSTCRFDGVKLVVGPDSAGADPGPACYGRGGPLTVTDANLFLGKIPPERFPFPLDCRAVERRLRATADEIALVGGRRYELPTLAEDFVRVANANMAKAIRSISVAKGCDPRDYVLVAFGGAGGQHACAVARELSMRQILDHPDGGLLSAYGIGMADVVRHGVAGVYEVLSPTLLARLEKVFERLTAEAIQAVLAEGTGRERIETQRALDLRYVGVEASLAIPCPAGHTAQQCAAAFDVEHRKLYGYVHSDRATEVVAARVEVRGRSEQSLASSCRVAGATLSDQSMREVYFGGQPRNAQLFDRQQLRPGDRFVGPAIVVQHAATTVVDPGWAAEVLSGGELLLTDEQTPQPGAVSEQADPATLEIFNNQFAGIAEQMGITLRHTSSSVNVKERLDFSCAIFTPAGDLVVNAPHIPIHLGAMGITVRAIVADNPQIRPGDVFVTNDPYRGGSHLPDITVVTPVFDSSGERIVFFTASRAHHAEIGGVVPGSMPPFSRSLADEGVLIRNFKLIDFGQPRWASLRALLLAAPHPTRSVEANLVDMAAQVAANEHGARGLVELAGRYSLPVVEAYLRHIQDAAEQKMRQALGRLREGRYAFVDHLDDGTPIAVTITIEGERAVIDFTGTGPVSSGNLNANEAIVTAAVMYVLRCLIAEDIPLNQGVLAPVTIRLPHGLLNPPGRERPEDCPAVVGGNVETSQRIVDVLLGALGLAAASQGTMNNVLFGDETFAYYETICGGAGATADCDGADAVHTHMTNTRLTDPEVIERRYPVRVREFSIRRGSGGEGRRRGGNGARRRLEFLAPLEVSILSERRGLYLPYGVEGGGPGQAGRNTLTRADGSLEQLCGHARFVAQPGDVLTIETPGGGGWGAPVPNRRNES